MISNCRLCHSSSVHPYLSAERPFRASYLICSNCGLVYLDECFLLEKFEEQSQYKLHQNDKRDPGYVNFLYKCLTPTLKQLGPGMKGLDFGCGPYPMLVELMHEEGFEMDGFDPYFFPSTHELEDKYDFVISTEVVEHFNDPHLSWNDMVAKVAKGGFLSVMTSLRYENIDFKSWHYRHDKTHVSFYSEKTMNWIADFFKLEVVAIEKNVFIFKKS